MARVKYGRYDPSRNPLPTRMHRGWASRAQRRHFLGDPKLRKYIAGNDYWTPPSGKRVSLTRKLGELPARVTKRRR